LILAKEGAGAEEVFETLKRERGLIDIDNKYLASINDLYIQAGINVDEKFLVIVAFSVGFLYFALLGLAFGYGLVAALLSAVCAVPSMLLVLVYLRSKRISKFSAQLPDAIDVIVRGVKSGYPFTIALGLVAKEMSDPVGTEFGMTSDEINFGSDMGAALDGLYHRVGHEDLLYLTMALKVQTQTGGNLGEILSRLARLIRERAMLRLKVRAISSEGRLSAVFLSVMPFIIFGLVTLLRPDYFWGVRHHPIIMPALIICLAMLALGNFIIYRMVNFKV
jgi:tight adherence protein B